MKQSILVRTFIIVLITITMILFLSWVLINFLTDDIYFEQKLTQIKNASDDIQFILDESNEDTDVVSNLKRLSITTGTDIHIFDEYNIPIYADYMLNRQGDRKFLLGKIKKSVIPNIVFDVQKGENVVVEYKQPLDKKNRLVYAKRYANGLLTVIQIPIEAIDDTVDIFKDILKNMIIVALIFGAIGAYFISKNITQPLVKLNNIAREMEKLNFSNQYQENREDEIGQLGKTLNSMSQTLQATIQQLKDELEKEKTLDVLRKQFVAQVSHEMQTPLAIIQGYTEALEDGIVKSEKEIKYHYEVIHDEINKMVKILRDLLDLSQLEAGTFKIKKERFDMTALLQKVSEKYYEITKQKDIKLILDQDTSETIINGDTFRLEQVLNNFIKNALEHTSSKGIINIKSQKTNSHIKITIENTGASIQEEDLPYIWESFYKSKEKSQNKGTGLGLAISKQILNLHDAQYGVENVEDGVIFWFKIKVEDRG